MITMCLMIVLSMITELVEGLKLPKLSAGESPLVGDMPRHKLEVIMLLIIATDSVETDI